MTSGREVLVFAELFFVNEHFEVPARQPHLETVLRCVLDCGLPSATCLLFHRQYYAETGVRAESLTGV